ncbi:MAG: DUF1963 domain-containing protein [Capnocytophaga sp.]|nr:DUF1963 domain-containing protein [Capnocytophaga sp.]
MSNSKKSPFIQQKIAEIKSKLARPCTAFETGGFRPTGERTESWIGRVFLCRPDEAKSVTDKHGKPLYALAQFYLPALPYVPESLKHITYLTVFMGEEFPYVKGEYGIDKTDENGEQYWEMHAELGNNGDGWLIREYTADDELIEYEFETLEYPKALPLKANYIAEDYPMWDGGGIPMDIEDEICDLKDEYDLDYHDDIKTAHSYQHKFGGYASFCQSGVDFSDDDNAEFVFQISSDEKAEFNVVDSGSLMFARTPDGKWKLYYDFY